jgi:hypothetical protein
LNPAFWAGFIFCAGTGALGDIAMTRHNANLSQTLDSLEIPAADEELCNATDQFIALLSRVVSAKLFERMTEDPLQDKPTTHSGCPDDTAI